MEAKEPSAPPQSLAFGPFVIDRAGSRLLRDGVPLDLPPKAWLLLCELASRPGTLLTKEALFATVWAGRVVTDASLKVAVNTLRQVLGEDASAPRWVHTVARRGYRFADAVQLLGEPPSLRWPAHPGPVATPSGAGAGVATDTDSAADTGTDAGTDTGTDTGSVLGNLPAPGTPLVGRVAALHGLCSLLGSERLVTLTGPGGVGKTRLALAAAAHAPPAGGVWLVWLDGLDQADAVGRAVARVLGLGDDACASSEALAQSLAPLQVRLLLDNAEHLAAGLAPQVATWLQHAPGLSVIVTSQRPLRLAGEHLWPVPPLELPAADADATARRSSPALQLMVQRIQGHRHGWAPATEDLAELAAIARALDGMPLALELAAARVPLLGTAGVRQRLDGRLRLLTTGPADAPARHQTLRASIDWSFGLLPEFAAQVLCSLAVCAGGFTADAAQALLQADDWDVLDALQLLQDMALLTRPPAPPVQAGAPAELPRLRLLDSVRLYGLQRLEEAGALGAAHDAHRAWVLAMFQAAEDAYLAMGMERWLAPVDAEADNLVAAMERGLAVLEHGRPAAAAGGAHALPAAMPATMAPGAASPLLDQLLSLAAASTHFCLRMGLGHVLKGWRDRLSACADAHGVQISGGLRARWCLAGALLGGQGLLRTPEALALGEEAVGLLAHSGPPARLLFARYVTGLFQLRLGRREALADTLAAMHGQVAAGTALSPYARRLAPMLQASVDQRDGNLAAYGQFWADFLVESRALGDRFEAWRGAWGLGQALFLQNQLDEAVAVMDDAVAQIRAAGRLRAQRDLAGQAVFMRLARDAGEQTMDGLREVAPLLQSNRTLFASLGDALAWVPLHQGRLDEALRVQAWADARLAAEQRLRSHVAKHLRQLFAERSGHALLPAAPPWDEATVLRRVLEGGSAAGAAPV